MRFTKRNDDEKRVPPHASCEECKRCFGVNDFILRCDGCEHWFHGFCVNIEEYEAFDIAVFHCSRCDDLLGHSVPKETGNVHRRNKSECVSVAEKGVESGSPLFIIRLLQMKMFPAEEVVAKLKGQQLTVSYLLKHDFHNPIVVECKDGLDIGLPDETFDETVVMSKLGGDYVLDVVDSRRQVNVKMKLISFVRQWRNPAERTNVFNCNSLEISRTELSSFVKVPNIVNKLCWVNTSWPPCDFKPTLNKYCVMSMENSYTDFHIDCGGTSTWYHLFKGISMFYLVEPTEENLVKYENWVRDPRQSERFFGGLVDKCYSLLLSKGQTLFMPSGWIHAVYAPTDCIAFAGNFLHSFNASKQLKIYEFEKKINAHNCSDFPYFELTHWYAAPTIMKFMQDYSKKFTSDAFVKGISEMVAALKSWQSKSKKNDVRSELIAPIGINCHKIICDLSKACKRVRKVLNGEVETGKRSRQTAIRDTETEILRQMQKRARTMSSMNGDQSVDVSNQTECLCMDVADQKRVEVEFVAGVDEVFD